MSTIALLLHKREEGERLKKCTGRNDQNKRVERERTLLIGEKGGSNLGFGNGEIIFVKFNY